MSSILSASNEGTVPPQRRIDVLLAHYGESHRHPTNVLIHCVAVPLIMLSLVGLLYAASAWAALVFLGASLIYYWRLSTVFLVSMAFITVLMLAVVTALKVAGVLLPACIAIFVVAWIFQFIGHRIEGKKPSFFEDIQYLWVGPLFVLSHFFSKLNIRW